MITLSARLATRSLASTIYLRGCASPTLYNHPIYSGRRNESTIPSNIKWDLVEEIVTKPELTGPIVAFSELGFVNKLFFPYTYSLMYYMDFLQSYFPWWASIVLTTASFRLLFLPVYIKQYKIGIKTHNILPETQKIQTKINESLANGDSYGIAMNRSKMKLLLDSKGIGTKDRLVPLLIQTPMFLSMFLLLRNYSNYPIASLATGGDLWFNNLLLPDPYYILPAIASVSTFILFEFGMDGNMTPTGQMTPLMKWFLRAVPVGIFLFTCKFPAAIVLFWSTNNAFTLLYAALLKSSWIKRKLEMPERINHAVKDLPLSSQSMKTQFKSAVEQGKVKKTTHDLRRLDDIAFRKAGIGPLKKTYKTKDLKVD